MVDEVLPHGKPIASASITYDNGERGHFHEGDLVRIPNSLQAGVVWRITNIQHRTLILRPTYSLFAEHLRTSNRCVDLDDDPTKIILVRMEDLGVEYLAFTQFLQRESG